MSQAKRYRRTILTSESGTGGVDLPFPASKITDIEVESGIGTVDLEALSTAGCRLMVTGGVLDGEVVLQWTQLP